MQAVLARRAIRATNASQRAEVAEQLKNTGNELYKKKDNVGAANLYVSAINAYGPKPVLLSNLAAAYLNLSLYEEALWAATTALEYDPRMIKARFRRAVARKHLFLYKSAIKDLEFIIAEDPTNEVLTEELRVIKNLLDNDEGVEESKADQIYPAFTDEPREYYSDSETTDCLHTGIKEMACRYYNHGGCARGRTCNFSHMPDEKSVRDELGKNVCLYFLFGSCEFGPAKCIYSHDRTHLPANGWWNDPSKVQAAKIVNKKEYEYESLSAAVRANPKSSGFAARQLRAEIIEDLIFKHDAALDDLQRVDTYRPPPNSDSFILILAFENDDLFTSIHTHLLAALSKKMKVVKVGISQEASHQALQCLASPNLRAVLVADPGIVKSRFHNVLKHLVEFVKKGGSAAMGGTFSSTISPNTFDEYISNIWGLDWKFGSYHRTTFSINANNEISRRNPSLHKSYSMKAVHMSNIKPEMAIYAPSQNSRLQSLVFAPVPITDLDESPAVCARVERGLLSFLGDVNAEEESTKTIMAMLGILDAPNKALEPLSHAPIASQSTSQSKGKGKGKQKESTTTASTSFSASQLKGISSSQGPSTSAELDGSDGLSKKFVLVIALEEGKTFEVDWAEQLSELKEKVQVKMATIASEAMSLLSSPDLCGIYIVDAGLTRSSNRQLLTKAVEYVKSGGLAAVGGFFPKTAKKADVSHFFSTFGVPWKRGTDRHCEAELNRHHITAVKNPSLPDAYFMSGIHLTGFHHEDMFYEQYIETDESDDYGFGGNAMNYEHEAPVLRTRIGKGQLGYIGDLNAEPDSTPILLSMLELLTPPADVVPDSSKFFIILSKSGMEEHLNEFEPGFIEEAKSKAEVLLDISNARVIDLLPSKDLLGVLVPDPLILERQNSYLLSKLVEYTKNSGTLIFGWLFGSIVTTTQFRPLFRDNFGLEWDVMGSDNLDASKVANNCLLQGSQAPAIPERLHLHKALCVKGIKKSMALYHPLNNPRFWKPKDQVFSSPVIYAEVEKGHIGFIGVRNLDSEIRNILFAMMGLH